MPSCSTRLGAGYDWAIRAAGTQVGDTVVVIGAGQRGLACVPAAEAGARVVLACRGRRDWVLEIAREWGAFEVVSTERQDLASVVTDLTDGEGADRVIDTSHHSTDALVAAVAAARPGGTVVAAGYKGTDGDPGLPPDFIYLKALTIRGVNGVSAWAKDRAIATVASGRVSFERYHSHTLALDQADRALQILAGEVDGEDPLHITLVA